MPMIAHWPGKIKAGTSSEHISAFYDVLPTLCEIAGIEPYNETDGLSFLPTLLGENQEEADYLFWEFPEYQGQQAVRMGKWKALRQDIKKGNIEIQLFNLEDDLLELNNVAEQYPEILEKMRQIMVDEHQQSVLKRFRMEALGDDVSK